MIWPDGPAGDAVREIYEELQRARAKFAPFKNGHEGHSVVREEFEEFWDAIKANDIKGARDEAVQLGAMAARFLVEVFAVNTLEIDAEKRRDASGDAARCHGGVDAG